MRDEDYEMGALLGRIKAGWGWGGKAKMLGRERLLRRKQSRLLLIFKLLFCLCLLSFTSNHSVSVLATVLGASPPTTLPCTK